MSVDPGERLASLEAHTHDLEKTVDELERHQKAAWDRIDEQKHQIEEVRLEQARENTRMEERLSGMEKQALKESFGMKTQIAEIGWRVGLIVSAALLILNFFLSRLDLKHFFDTPTSTTARRK